MRERLPGSVKPCGAQRTRFGPGRGRVGGMKLVPVVRVRAAVFVFVPRGGLGCVANTRVRNMRFWKCGNGWTYGRILGCVAGKGVRQERRCKVGRLNVRTWKSRKGPLAPYVFVKDGWDRG